MGGYGALRLGLGHPDSFCSIHSHSGALDRGATVLRMWQENQDPDGPNRPEEILRIFGSNPLLASHDPLELAKKSREDLPAILIDCGTEDFLLQANRDFVAALQAEKIPHTYVEHPGGHDWNYWDTHIQEALRFHASHLGIPAQ